MADVATQDDGVLFKTSLFGIPLEYTKTDAAIDGTLVAGGALLGGVGAAPAAGIAALRSGAMMLGRGILRSVFKTAAKEGVEVAAKTAAKATVETGAKAAVKETAEAAAKKGTVDWVAPTLSKETAEFAAKKAAERTARETAEATAKAAAKEGVEAGAGAAASAAAKEATKEAVESTSKSLLGVAAKAGSYAWTGAKIVAAPIAYPKTFILGASAGHVLTGGLTSSMIWGGYTGLWNLGKEYVPGATSAVAEAALKLGDGTMGFLKTGAKMGAQGLSEYLPSGLVPTPVRVALGASDASAARESQPSGSDAPTLRDRANAAASGVRERVTDAAEDIDFMNTPEAGPFREMIANQLNMDPAKVTGKELTRKLGQLAKDNPYFGIGMAFGALYGGMGADKNPAQRAMGAAMYGAIFGFAFQFLGQMYPGLLPGVMKMISGAPDVLAKVPGAIGLNTSSLNDGFRSAAEGTSAAPTNAPEQQNPSTPTASQFAQAASGKPAPAPAPEDVDLRRNRPEAANNAAYRLTVGAPA